jgi:hypothetical protein
MQLAGVPSGQVQPNSVRFNDRTAVNSRRSLNAHQCARSLPRGQRAVFERLEQHQLVTNLLELSALPDESGSSTARFAPAALSCSRRSPLE